MSGQPFVFNLGHGIVPETPPENVGRLVELVRSAGLRALTHGRVGSRCQFGVSSPAVRAAIAIVVTVALLAAAGALFGQGAYLWVKAVHVIAVISWMAGMLYLPRLFIYHCDAPVGSPQSETFKVMEKRLLTIIINPAMIADLGAGALAGLAGRIVLCRLVSCQIRLSVSLFPACTDTSRARCAGSARIAIR